MSTWEAIFILLLVVGIGLDLRLVVVWTRLRNDAREHLKWAKQQREEAEGWHRTASALVDTLKQKEDKQ